MSNEDLEKKLQAAKEFGISNYVAIFLAIVVGMIIVWDSWYLVDKDEEATVLRFGVYISTVAPGLHFKIPLYDVIEKTSVTKVHRIEIGFRTVDSDGNSITYTDVPEEAQMLTSDDNIAEVTFVVQYLSNDAYKWQFTVEKPEQTLNLMAQAAMRLVVGRSPFDKIATIGKAEVQLEAAQVLQGYIDQIDMGATIVDIQLQDVDPPAPVVDAFKDVVNAREEKAAMIQDAKRHANKVLPGARGEAAQVVNDAEGYASERTEAATGDVSRYTEVLGKYQANPGVTAQRLRFETQERVLRGSQIVVDPGDSGVLKLLNLSDKPSAITKQ